MKTLLFTVLLSQVAIVCFSTFDFLQNDIYALSQENEEPKPVEENSSFDLLEEHDFLIADLSIFTFFLYEILNTFHKMVVFVNITNTLDTPPPEAA